MNKIYFILIYIVFNSCGSISEEVVERYSNGSIKMIHFLKGNSVVEKILFSEKGDTLGWEKPIDGEFSKKSLDFKFHTNDFVKEKHIYNGISLTKKEFYNNRGQFSYSVDKDGNKEYGDAIDVLYDKVFFDGKQRERITNSIGGKDGIILDIIILGKTTRVHHYASTKKDTLFWEKPQDKFIRELFVGKRGDDFKYKMVTTIDSVTNQIIYYDASNYRRNDLSLPNYNLVEKYEENGIIKEQLFISVGFNPDEGEIKRRYADVYCECGKKNWLRNKLGEPRGQKCEVCKTQITEGPKKIISTDTSRVYMLKKYSKGVIDGEYYIRDKTTRTSQKGTILNTNYELKTEFREGQLDGNFYFTGPISVLTEQINYEHTELTKSGLNSLIDIIEDDDDDHVQTGFRIKINTNFVNGKLNGDLTIKSQDYSKDFWEGDIDGIKEGVNLFWGVNLPQFLYDEKLNELLLVKGSFVNGKLNGDFIQYATTGILLRQGNFKNGLPDNGIFVESRRSEIFEIVINNSIVNYKNGKKNGFAYYENDFYCYFVDDKITSAIILDYQYFLLRKFSNNILTEYKCKSLDSNDNELNRSKRACQKVSSFSFDEDIIEKNTIDLSEYKENPLKFKENILTNVSDDYRDRRCMGGEEDYMDFLHRKTWLGTCSGLINPDKQFVINNWMESIDY